MSVEKAIGNILDKNLDEMRANFSSALSEKAVMKLDEKKAEIGKAYFGQVRESLEQISEKTIASKKAKKGTKYKVQSKDPDDEGSLTILRQGKRKIDSGDYDRGARAFFMKKGTYDSAKDILNTVKEEAEELDEVTKKRMKRELRVAGEREIEARDGFGNDVADEKAERNYKSIKAKYGQRGLDAVERRAQYGLYGKRVKKG